MKKKNPQNKLQSLQKMKVITGINKGEKSLKDLEIELSKEREKNLLLESENKSLKAKQKKQEIIDKDLEWFLEDNGKYLIEVDSLLTYLTLFVQWSKDSQKNNALRKSIEKGNELNRIKNLRPQLEKAIERLSSFKPKGRKPGEDRPKPKQEAFKNWVKDYKIDTRLTLDTLTDKVDQAFDNGEIKIRIGRDTVRECLLTLRKKK